MIQETKNPSANMGNPGQGAGIDQPNREPRIPRRVDAGGEATPGHRLDQPRPTEESMQQQSTPKESGILKQALPYLIPAITLGGGTVAALWTSFLA